MCEASSLHPYRKAITGDIAKVGSVPGYPMRGLFEDGKEIKEGPEVGDHQPPDRALLVCGRAGATLFIERMKFMLSSKMHNSEFANAENIECTFHTAEREFAVGDGFVMRNGLLIPLVDILDGTRVRFGMAFA